MNYLLLNYTKSGDPSQKKYQGWALIQNGVLYFTTGLIFNGMFYYPHTNLSFASIKYFFYFTKVSVGACQSRLGG